MSTWTITNIKSTFSLIQSTKSQTTTVFSTGDSSIDYEYFTREWGPNRPEYGLTRRSVPTTREYKANGFTCAIVGERTDFDEQNKWDWVRNEDDTFPMIQIMSGSHYKRYYALYSSKDGSKITVTRGPDLATLSRTSNETAVALVEVALTHALQILGFADGLASENVTIQGDYDYGA